jgi:hypothetical protein
MRLAYRLVGYDKTTERVALEIDIPSGKAGAVRQVAGIDARELADWPLNPEQVRHIVRRILGRNDDVEKLDFFLEPSAAHAHA